MQTASPSGPLYRLEPEGSLFAPAADKSTVLEYYKTLESHTPTRGNGWKGGTSMEWMIGKANAKAAKKVERA